MAIRTTAKDIIATAEAKLADVFITIDEIAQANQLKVLTAFRDARITEEHFAEKTGYAIDNAGREALDAVFAQIFRCESACMRMQFVSGTHALACAILGNIGQRERLVCLTGEPYDSLQPVLGITGDEPGSLKKIGGVYEEIDLGPVIDDCNVEELARLIAPHAPATIYYIQKSRGYSMTRRTYSNSDIKKMADAARMMYPEAIVMVDNCYGEFVEALEPTQVGADLVAGSMIKNPGGGLCVTGGYIAGKKKYVEAALNRLTAPGV